MAATLTYRPKIDDPYSSHARILAYAGSGNGRKLLDVGSAQGVLAEQFQAAGFEVTCIENNPEWVELARPRCRHMIVADLEKTLPELPGPYDVIVYGDVLEHLKDPLAVLTTLNRALRPGGTVIVSIPNFVHLFVRLNVICGRFEYMDRGILDRTHLRFFTLTSFRRLLQESGLRIEHLSATPVPLPLIVPVQYHGWLLRLLHAINAGLARFWKRMFGYQFVAVARWEGD